MVTRRIALLVAALLLLAWTWAPSGAEYTDLGGGLLMRPDGTVIGAWELPGVDVTANAFDAPEPTIAMQATPAGIWRARFDRGW